MNVRLAAPCSEGQAMTDWVILRTSGASTLPLAESLTEAGFRVWTPVQPAEKREGKSRSRKREVEAMVPEWVFAESHHLSELLALTHQAALIYRVWDAEKRRHVVKGHPYFRLLKDGDGFAMVGDRELESLRVEERKGKPKVKAHEFKAGDTVKVTSGPYEALTGIVEIVRAPYVSVQFPQSSHVHKLPFWVLTLAEKSTAKAA